MTISGLLPVLRFIYGELSLSIRWKSMNRINTNILFGFLTFFGEINKHFYKPFSYFKNQIGFIPLTETCIIIQVGVLTHCNFCKYLSILDIFTFLTLFTVVLFLWTILWRRDFLRWVGGDIWTEKWEGGGPIGHA